FCAIPGIRGRYRSRTVTSVVQEAEALLQRGIRELNLVSQDTTGYGRDWKDGTNLPGLIHQLGRLGGTFWIRLLYGYPTGVTDALLDAMAETPQVCHYLDVPIQHSHPDVLASMKRGGTVTSLGNMAFRIRRAMPDAAIRTTCLVGFPGETEEHVRHLEEFLRCAAFDHVGVFVYSPEEGTPAFSLGPGVDADEAEARRTRLLEVQRAVVDRKLEARIGTTGEVLLENPLDGGAQCWAARNRYQAPEVDGCVRVSGIKARKPAGQIVTVRYTVAAGYDLHAVGQ
ncbi:MAG: radical SAM protein, partial [Deltaproteobacteria bacterium]